MVRVELLVLSASLLCLVGCATDTRLLESDIPIRRVPEGKSEKTGVKNGESKDGEKTEKAETLLEWNIGKRESHENDRKGEDKDKEKPMPHDRPHFTDASTTVGLGRVMLETGYTFTRDRTDGTNFAGHSYPESLLRIGMFAEWFEARIGWNYGNQRIVADGNGNFLSGSEDLLLGVRLALTEQKSWLPETAVTLEMNVPTGSRAFTAGQVLPAARLHYGWELFDERIGLEGMTVIERQREDSGHGYVQVAQSFNIEYNVTKKLQLFTEWFAFIPSSALDPQIGPEHYFNAGFTYLFTKDFGWDLRTGVGLNRRAADFFAGSGFVMRF